MKIASLIFSSLSILMVLSTLICGIWLRTQGATPDGVDFHVKFASATVLIVVISLGLLIALALRIH